MTEPKTKAAEPKAEPKGDEPKRATKASPDDYYAPNQQVVRADGSGPAEEGSGGSAGTPRARKAKADTKG